jgi:CubicO group peptidase (beta-lactamase class C family)
MTLRTLLKTALGALTLVLAQPAFAQPTGPAPAPPAPVAQPVPTNAPAHPTLERADVEAWLDGYLPNALQTGDIAGAVVVVVKGGQVLLQKGYGYSDAAKRTPVDPETTLFRPGSISKTFAWTAVMQQVEAGKLDLDADVNRYLDFKIPARNGKPVTLRNLMTHTAGFEDTLRDLVSDDPKGPMAFDAYLKRWVPPVVYAPGTTPAYSNYGTALAGYIAARAAGEPSFEVYVERHILGPLGMTHSTFRQPLPAQFQPHMSKGYDLGSGAPRALRDVLDLSGWRQPGHERGGHGAVHDRPLERRGLRRCPAS